MIFSPKHERGNVNKQLSKPKKVVLAYSGGLDTSIIIPWLKENYQCEVIAMIGDVGQQEDLEAARKKALANGASSAYVEDLREEFVCDYIWPTLRAGAVYEHTYLLGTSMARPILGKREVEIGFEAGFPVSVNGTKASAVELLSTLNEVAAKHGIGRTDIVENRLVGMKSRGAYETPGGTLLVTAHRELEALTVDRETAHFQQALSQRYAELVYYGLWFSPLRAALDGFFSASQQRVTGAVGLTLWKGTLTVTKRVSPFSLYRTDLASFTMGRYNSKDAEGFINLFALPVTVRPKAKAESGND